MGSPLIIIASVQLSFSFWGYFNCIVNHTHRHTMLEVDHKHLNYIGSIMETFCLQTAELCPFQKYPIRHTQGSEWCKPHLSTYHTHKKRHTWKGPQLLPSKRDGVNGVHSTNLPFPLLEKNFPFLITEFFSVESDFLNNWYQMPPLLSYP